jgi:exonuclease III
LRDLLPGYTLWHIPRPSRRGGGVAIIYRDCLQPSLQPKFTASSFESFEALFQIDSACLRLIVLYRPPPSSQNGLTKAMFFQEFTNLLEQNISSSAANL